MRIRNAYLLACALLLAGLLSTSIGAADENAASASALGDLWDTSSQMSMEGMPMSMPAHSMKICARHGATHPPVGSDPNQKCENSNFQRTDSTVSWTSTCKNPPMTGEGKITYDSPDSYSGALKYTSEGHTVTINLTGKKIGACDKPLD